MTAVNQDFKIVAGDSKNITITITNDDGVGLNLLNATIKWVLKKSTKNTANVLLKTEIDGITITDSQNGVMQIKLLPSDTLELGGSRLYHECEVTDQSGNVSTVTSGIVSISHSGV
jgi:hypothetical protein